MKGTAAAVSLPTAAVPLTCPAGRSGTTAPATPGATASPPRRQTPARCIEAQDAKLR
ncbi:hypothetical protein OR263_27650 [Streptomyces sp. NEAU-H22]|uniref:hypothetical protein n=1 Tax=Streptomyces sp. NEAU-H22 TaxID=2994655 RepID=UPI00224FCAB2|nr:hypothetical protein [Streptomyces sp. NEAU-H22]MCX3290440.1 hypothetical protein [Streptomyces sp. NEAU-H22]